MIPLFRVLTASEAIRRAWRYMVLRRWLCVGVVLATFVLSGGLTGCATADPYAWESTPRYRALRAEHVTVARGGIERACGRYPGLWVHGCAARRFDEGLCIIYTEPDPPRWVMEHELRHCAGWEHS